jgi:hypothetical protein
MPKEESTTLDAAAAAVSPVSPSKVTESRDSDEICDFDEMRMNEVDRITAPDGTRWSVRQCSADPAHVKRVPL